MLSDFQGFLRFYPNAIQAYSKLTGDETRLFTAEQASPQIMHQRKTKISHRLKCCFSTTAFSRNEILPVFEALKFDTHYVCVFPVVVITVGDFVGLESKLLVELYCRRVGNPHF